MSDDDLEIGALLDAIYLRYQYDFRGYSMASLRRRVRSALGQFGAASVDALREHVVRDAGLFTELLRYLTVQHSELFRDPAYFRAVREIVVPYLRTYPFVKLWVAGCATGEEAYSFAIILAEEGLLDRARIYATDIHAESLRIGADGAYELGRFAKFSESYRAAGGHGSLADFYTASSTLAVFDRALRKAITFSDHSLATDTAFAEVELASCRNVLIYFERPLQERALGLLRGSLVRRGFLGLGSKETLRFTSHAPAFTELASGTRLYQRND